MLFVPENTLKPLDYFQFDFAQISSTTRFYLTEAEAGYIKHGKVSLTVELHEGDFSSFDTHINLPFEYGPGIRVTGSDEGWKQIGKNRWKYKAMLKDMQSNLYSGGGGSQTYRDAYQGTISENSYFRLYYADQVRS